MKKKNPERMVNNTVDRTIFTRWMDEEIERKSVSESEREREKEGRYGAPRAERLLPLVPNLPYSLT